MSLCRVPVQSVQWFFSGTWYDMSRTGDNYFVIQAINSQPLILPAQVKITSIFGDIVIDTVATSKPEVWSNLFQLICSPASMTLCQELID